MDDDRMSMMMRSMMGGMPFPPMFPAPFGSPFAPHDPFSSLVPHHFQSMVPAPFMPPMLDPFGQLGNMMSMVNTSGAPGLRYCSSSFTSYTTDEHGRPQVYQQSSEVKQGPDGLKETKSSLRDSKSGRQELAIGHHIHDKAHITKKSKNAYTGEEEQAEDFVNLDETEAETFEKNWSQQARNFSASNQLCNQRQNARSSRGNRLALTSSAHEDRSPSLVDKVKMKIKKKKSKKATKE